MTNQKILTILLCSVCASILFTTMAWMGHHFHMIILEQCAHAMLICMSILGIFSILNLLVILVLQFIKLLSAFKTWFGKQSAYIKEIEKEAMRLKKQKEALENGE